jgi:hypothetical protein
MEKAMKKSRIPQTDSIQELAEFWDTHDSTDFEDELVEVTEPVFESRASIQILLQPREVKAVQRIAQAEGVSREELIRKWVAQRLSRRNGRAPSKPAPSKRRSPATKK